jgi:hypothetical protein
MLKLTCGAEFGVLVVNGWVMEYLQKFPRVQADVESTNRIVESAIGTAKAPLARQANRP